MSAKILLIDDDADFRDSLQAVLEAEGYEVITAASGKEGLQKLTAKPDLVVCDVMMESIVEGYAVTLELKFKDMPVIMCSSIEGSPDELFPRSEEVGAIRPDAYLRKPLDIPVFLETVRRLLGGKVTA
jgi:CheY-like chemotaxis protein